jgi:hypothetical protein
MKIFGIILFITLISYIILFIINWYVTIETYNGYINKKKDKLVAQALMEQIGKNGYKINSFNDGIIRVGDLPYISHVSPKFFGFGYYMNDIGAMPIWSKSHKICKLIFIDSKKRNNQSQIIQQNNDLDLLKIKLKLD